TATQPAILRKARRRTREGSSSSTKQRRQKLARPWGTGQVHRDRSTIRPDDYGERKKPAALPLCVDRPGDVGKDLAVCREAESKPIRKLDAFGRALQQCVEQILAPSFQGLRTQRTRNRKIGHAVIIPLSEGMYVLGAVASA